MRTEPTPTSVPGAWSAANPLAVPDRHAADPPEAAFAAPDAGWDADEQQPDEQQPDDAAADRAGPGPRGSRPTLRRLAGLSGWAALLGLLGIGVGIRGLVAVLVTTPPPWYEPTLILIGIGGIVITAAAFVTARRGNLPWILLGAASAVLVTSLVITGVAVD